MRCSFDAILFDIDGTLVDSTDAVERIWRAWAPTHGLDAEAVLAKCHGRRTEDTIADLLPRRERAEAAEQVHRLEGSDLGGVVALPGVRALLASLDPGEWAAVTSGPRELMRSRLVAAGLPVPPIMVAAEDVAAGKPDPEGYLRAATALGADIGRCLVVEDSPAGIAAGRDAGARVLAVATSHDVSELGAADLVLPDLTGCSIARARNGLAEEEGGGAIEVTISNPLPAEGGR